MIGLETGYHEQFYGVGLYVVCEHLSNRGRTALTPLYSCSNYCRFSFARILPLGLPLRWVEHRLKAGCPSPRLPRHHQHRWTEAEPRAVIESALEVALPNERCFSDLMLLYCAFESLTGRTPLRIEISQIDA